MKLLYWHSIHIARRPIEMRGLFFVGGFAAGRRMIASFNRITIDTAAAIRDAIPNAPDGAFNNSQYEDVMKIVRSGILFIPLAAAFVIAGRAEAQQSRATLPWYIEGSFGESRWDPSVESTYQALGASFDRRDTSYGFLAGLPLSQYLSLELGHTNFGKLSANGIFAGQPAGGGAPYLNNARFKANTTYAAVAAQVPVGQAFTVFGQLGYGSTTRKIASDDIAIPTDAGTLTIFGENSKNRKSEMLYGFGAGYAFSKTVTGLLRYQKLDDTKASALMLGVRLAL